jgi:hypothetical protein
VRTAFISSSAWGEVSWRAVAVAQLLSQLFHQSGTVVVEAGPSAVLSLQVLAEAWRHEMT